MIGDEALLAGVPAEMPLACEGGGVMWRQSLMKYGGKDIYKYPACRMIFRYHCPWDLPHPFPHKIFAYPLSWELRFTPRPENLRILALLLWTSSKRLLQSHLPSIKESQGTEYPVQNHNHLFLETSSEASFRSSCSRSCEVFQTNQPCIASFETH